MTDKYRSETPIEQFERLFPDEVFELLIGAELAKIPPDPYLFLANVKTHLANKVMEAGDVQAWYVCHDAQQALDENTRNVMRRLDAYLVDRCQPPEYDS